MHVIYELFITHDSKDIAKFKFDNGYIDNIEKNEIEHR